MKTILVPLLALGLLAGVAGAQGQPVTMNAQIEQVTGFTICPGFGFRVTGTGIFLESNTVDLSQHVGDIVRITGTAPSPFPCAAPVIFVDQVGFATATLKACGVPAGGCPVKLTVGPPTISQNSLWFSTAPQGFLNAGDPLGVWVLGTPFTHVFPGGPPGSITLTVPQSFALVGLSVDFQGHHIEIGPIHPPGSLTNPLRITIQPPGLFCIDPNSCPP